MKSPLALFAWLAALAALASAGEPPAAPALPDGLYAEFATPRGVITAELFYRQAPLTVASFTGLAEGTLGPKKGTPFFDGLKFHRVAPNFVVQGGDPLGTGEGGPGFSFADEFAPGLRHDAAGVLSMANSGPDTNGSQFFFTLREVNRLNYLHSVFGRVVRGLELLPQIRAQDPMTTVRIHRVGPAALAFRADQAAFDALAARTGKYTGAAAPGPAAHFDDPDQLLPSDPPRALAFQRKLANFERATGRKLYARLAARFVAETPNQRPGHLAGSLAKKLGLPPASVLAVYFADVEKWGLWIGDDYLPPFAGRTGSLAELMQGGGLHQAKQDFLAAAKVQADLATTDFALHTAPGEPLTPAQKLKFQVDAVLDALIFKFEPKS
jgi:cyclophilin family peptidyl-prolyl cis-trans isomerase